MPLYEIVLRRDDEDDEVRMTDQPIRVGERLRVDLETWQAVGEEPPEHPDADGRFVLRLLADEDGKAS